jgi:hypothetical protein
MPYIGNQPYQGVIDSGNIVDGSIQTGDLANSAITTLKIADSNVTSAKIADTGVTVAKLASDVTQLITQGSVTKITNLTYSGDDLAVSTTSPLPIIITGTNFETGSSIYIDTITPANAATAISYTGTTQITCTPPVKSAASYNLWLVGPTGKLTVLANGILYSGTPNWSGQSTSISSDASNVNIQLTAAGDTPLVYSLVSGTLPTGVTLNSSGLISGAVTGLTNDTTYSNLVIRANDPQNQDASITVNLTILTLYRISRSLRFNYQADSTDLNRTFTQAGNRKTWTLSMWFKRTLLATTQTLFSYSISGDSNGWLTLWITNDDKLRFQNWNGWYAISDMLFRDPSAWYHIVLSVDTTQSVAANRVKLYVNGSLITYTNDLTFSLNQDTLINSANIHYIGKSLFDTKGWNGYLTEINFIDGQALTANSFGSTDGTTGVWKPIAFVGTYGTNGFYLNFSDPSNNTATTLGKDYSGNGNNWTPTNFTVTDTTTTWSRYFTYSDGSGLVPNNRIFDGTTGYGGASKNNVIQNFVPPTPISYSTLEVAFGNGNNSGSPGASLSLNGSVVQSAPASSGGANAIYTTSTPGTLTSLSISAAISGQYESNIYKIKVNGKYLIDPVFNDSSTDSPVRYVVTDTGSGGEIRGNYAIWNPLANFGSASIYDGGMSVQPAAANTAAIPTTIFQNTGKWYWEVCVNNNAANNASLRIGICNTAGVGTDLGGTANTWCYLGDGRIYSGGTASSYGVAISTCDILNVAVDIDAGKIWYGKNGTWMANGNPSTGANPSQTFTANQSISPAVASGIGQPIYMANFGQRPFTATMPTGYKTLCTTNLTTPSIVKSNTAFDTIVYPGNGSSQTISSLNFNPDLVWIKGRTTTYSNYIFDSIRGATKMLYSESTSQEDTGATSLTAFNSNGFTIDSNVGVNNNTTSHVAWIWDAGTTTTTNTAGSVSAQTRVNQSSGICIATYTATANGQTFGHGLGTTPVVSILKRRDSTSDWYFNIAVQGINGYMLLNSPAARTSAYSPTATTTACGYLGGLSENWVAYVFAPIAGFSSFGSYTGNASTNGPFIYLGFRPAFVMVKRTDSAVVDWWIYDKARNPTNKVNYGSRANSSAVEVSDVSVDFLSNGFKFQGDIGAPNQLNGTYFYMAFAETPFNYSLAR